MTNEALLTYLRIALALACSKRYIVVDPVQNAPAVRTGDDWLPTDIRIAAGNVCYMHEAEVVALFTLLAQEARVRAVIVLRETTQDSLPNCVRFVDSLRTEAPADLSAL